MPQPASIATGVARQTRTAMRISKGSIFLPRYSGVRPTISPMMKTVRMTKPIIP